MKRFFALLTALLPAVMLTLTAFASPIPAIADDTSAETQATETAGGLEIAAEENATDSFREIFYEGATEAETEVGVPTQAATEPQGTVKSDPAQQDTDHLTLSVVIIGGALILTVTVILIVLLLRRRDPGVAGGTAVRIEVLSGRCYNTDFDFRFRRGLTIGTSKECDLVFDDPAMLPTHAVISRISGRITLSECADTRNTYIGGMKIFAPNRLRSGDIVTVGTTSFRIHFDTK